MSSSTYLNAQQSPLLRLPAEIRNRIYELVLGGNRVHISPRKDPWGNRYRPVICGVHPDNEDIEEDYKTNGRLDSDDERLNPPKLAFDQTHRRCIDRQLDWSICGSSDYLSLSLLRVCRQTHQETALLPFSLNTFVVTPIRDLADFLSALTMSQKNAIEALTLLCRCHFFHPTLPARWTSRLDGLRSLTITVEAWNTPKSLQELMKTTALNHSELYSNNVSWQPVADVKVKVFQVAESEYRAFRMVRIQEYPSLAREYEKALLKSSDGQGQDEAK